MPTNKAPQVAINDIGSPEEFLAAIDATIKYFNDGDIVEGTVVKVDHDEDTRPKASSPYASSPSNTTSTQTKSSKWATRSTPSSSPKKTKKAD